MEATGRGSRGGGGRGRGRRNSAYYIPQDVLDNLTPQQRAMIYRGREELERESNENNSTNRDPDLGKDLFEDRRDRYLQRQIRCHHQYWSVGNRCEPASVERGNQSAYFPGGRAIRSLYS